MDTPLLSFDDCRAYVSNQLFSHTSEDTIGIELEMLPLIPSAGDAAPARVPLHSHQGGTGIFSVLKDLAARQGWQFHLEHTAHLKQELLAKIITDENDYFTFEPGGQLEFSSRPYQRLDQMNKRLHTVEQLLDKEFARHGWSLLQLGANPWHSVEEIGLEVPKPRYAAMDAYFSSIGPYGQMMMRQTCSIQVCLDFGSDEATMVERYLAAMLLSPFATAIFANSPFRGGNTLTSSIESQRSLIWHYLDPSRCGFPALEQLFKQPSRASCIDTYTQFLLAAPVIYISQLGYKVPAPSLTFARWLKEGYQGVSPSLQDFIAHSTLHFPEVRPRGFMELRSVDCQARVWQMVPAAFYLGLLYSAPQRRKVLDLLSPLHNSLAALRADAMFGMQKSSIARTATTLMTWAGEGLANLPSKFRHQGIEKSFHAFAKYFTVQKKTPAQETIEQARAEGRLFPSLATYKRLEERWQSLVST